MTCVVENENEFIIDEGIWDSFDELLPAEDVEVVVALIQGGSAVEYGVTVEALIVQSLFSRELLGATPTILIVDFDLKSYQMVQKVFNDNVNVVWGTILDFEQLDTIECSIILFSVQGTEDYERAYEMNRRFENAIMFLLAEQHLYDAFEARNAGAVGAFFKPLHLSRIYDRIVELLPNSSNDDAGI